MANYVFQMTPQGDHADARDRILAEQCPNCRLSCNKEPGPDCPGVSICEWHWSTAYKQGAIEGYQQGLQNGVKTASESKLDISQLAANLLAYQNRKPQGGYN